MAITVLPRPRPGLVDAHHHVGSPGRRPPSCPGEPARGAVGRPVAEDPSGTAPRKVAGRRLEQTVAVQCVPSQPGTRELLARAERDPLIGGVVGWVDLTSLAIRDILDTLRHGPGGSSLRALRHVVQGEADCDWLQRPVVEWGLRTVRDLGLGYDLLIHAHQLPQAIRLAEAVPGLPLVLDHAGGPGSTAGERADWERHIRVLAGHAQVRCKMSGLVAGADRARGDTAGARRVWDVLLSTFGPERLMFASDWPACGRADGWSAWAATVEEVLDECSAPETRAVLAGTATEFYRLDGIGGSSTAGAPGPSVVPVR
ncbi:amidohydrolase family protein [Streptomyces scabiei]|uniref:amidohydrolase family protein n=1 Tax=Streptomyces scabiei TaxID=1930 RepID=UPI0029A7FECC|nr:amidohydrolase family protein [Streptomyces scabiei]MDX3520096.1 amidohydrolase family protein [Streptomyces scabiei]